VSESRGVEAVAAPRAAVQGRSKPLSAGAATRESSKSSIQEEISRLGRLERGALQVRWAELFGSPPNPRLRRGLLIMVLTYRIQELAFGGLKPATRKKLLSHVEGFSKDKEIVSKQVRATKPGTRIVRYDGRQYRSLSEIARQITGTRWSGPAFFGLKKRGKAVAA
jgi:hypothetical protein